MKCHIWHNLGSWGCFAAISSTEVQTLTPKEKRLLPGNLDDPTLLNQFKQQKLLRQEFHVLIFVMPCQTARIPRGNKPTPNPNEQKALVPVDHLFGVMSAFALLSLSSTRPKKLVEGHIHISIPNEYDVLSHRYLLQ